MWFMWRHSIVLVMDQPAQPFVSLVLEVGRLEFPGGYSPATPSAGKRSGLAPACVVTEAAGPVGPSADRVQDLRDGGWRCRDRFRRAHHQYRDEQRSGDDH